MPASTLTALLDGLTADQKASRKAEAIAAIANNGKYTLGNKTVTVAKLVGYSYVTSGVTITLTAASYDAATGVIWLTVTASDARGLLPTDDRYGFRNPPILVVTVPPVLDASGHVITPAVTAENVATAARTMLYEAVIWYALRHGWAPA